MRRAFVTFSTFFSLLLLSACGADQASETTGSAELRTGPWHANITVPGGDIKFGMEVTATDRGPEVTLINGSERVRVPAVKWDDAELTLRFPAFNNEVRARLKGNELSGTLTFVKRYGKTQVMPFVARPGARPAADNTLAAATDVSGRWAVTFTEPDNTRYPAVGECSQRGNRLLGTFLTETGDYRYLGGIVGGKTMELSTFDGAHAFLFTATVDEAGQMSGNFWSGTEYQETWTGVRNAEARLADPTTLPKLKPGYDRFTFEFPDREGQLVSLDDARFDNKIVVVTLAGSWCPNCHDEAAFMSEIYPACRERGVEVVALMFEHLEEEAAAIEQIREFREKFDIEYVTLLAGISDKALAHEALPALDKVLAFPTTIFIDREGGVREIHTGFSGPGTGKHYDETRQYITGVIDSLIAERADNATEETS